MEKNTTVKCKCKTGAVIELHGGVFLEKLIGAHSPNQETPHPS
jgi:hypothetical protein